MTVQDGNDSVAVEFDAAPMTLQRVADSRYSDGTHELRMAADGPQVRRADQVIVWGCKPAN